MSWAKLDDRFHDNRKVRRAWLVCPASVGLYALALTYCAGHETDGRVDEEFVAATVPKPRDRDRMVAALLDAGLWQANGQGWIVNDYLDFNPSHDALNARREAKREAGRRGGRASAAARAGGNQT